MRESKEAPHVSLLPKSATVRNVFGAPAVPVAILPVWRTQAGRFLSPYLECQPGLDLLLEDVCNRAIKVGQNLHGQLRVDAVVCNQIIEGIRERRAEAAVEPPG